MQTKTTGACSPLEFDAKDRMAASVLLIEDDDDSRELLTTLIETQDCSVDAASGYTEAVRLLEQRGFDAVLTDLHLGARGGLDICEAVSRLQPGVPVIMVTGHGSLTVAVESIRAGAYDFITKPIDAQLLGVSLRRALEHRSIQVQLNELKRTSVEPRSQGKLVGQSEPMLRVYDLVSRVADTPASVLICGESGTGKELVAQALHSQSQRKDGAFMPLNCGAVPAQLLEAELFGHEKGAFTDARSARLGLLERANGGTLFLDEIGEMPPAMQVKLLRVLQERKVRPVGGTQERDIDVRVVAATHRDLETEIEEGRFREDLYYRLNVVQLNLPPLRSRGNDILLLAAEFIRHSAERLGREVKGLSAEAAELLFNFDWPGNVRQLQNCIERAVTLARFDTITPEDLPEKIRGHVPHASSSGINLDPEHVQPMEVIERQYIEQVLEFTGNNKSQSAKLLGMDRRTLYRKLESYSRPANGKDNSGPSR